MPCACAIVIKLHERLVGSTGLASLVSSGLAEVNSTDTWFVDLGDDGRGLEITVASQQISPASTDPEVPLELSEADHWHVVSSIQDGPYHRHIEKHMSFYGDSSAGSYVCGYYHPKRSGSNDREEPILVPVEELSPELVMVGGVSHQEIMRLLIERPAELRLRESERKLLCMSRKLVACSDQDAGSMQDIRQIDQLEIIEGLVVTDEEERARSRGCSLERRVTQPTSRRSAFYAQQHLNSNWSGAAERVTFLHDSNVSRMDQKITPRRLRKIAGAALHDPSKFLATLH